MIKLAARIRFYLWVGLAYGGLQILAGLWKQPDIPFYVILDHLWLTVFVTAVNALLFEITFTFLQWKKLHFFLGGILLHLILYPFVFYLWKQLGEWLHVYTPLTIRSYWQWLEYLMGYAMGSVFFFGICRHVYTYLHLKRLALQLKIEKQEAELNYLKAQTNPHFLFNTLHNIYSLAREKSAVAPESILKLSEILRYMLYETGNSRIAIEKEIKILSDYIALEKLRYDETLQVHFQQDIEDMQQGIPPLLLMPLVENAFKHGVAETRHRPFVEIQLSVREDILHFSVRNSAAPPKEHIPNHIGLPNLKRQLELLFTDYSLTTGQDQENFTAALRINLASHV